MQNTCHSSFQSGSILTNYCEQNYVLPSNLSDAIVNRMMDLGFVSEKDAENTFRTFLQGRRTDQGKMVMVRNFLR